MIDKQNITRILKDNYGAILWLLLLALSVIYFSAFELGYPSVGYHNTKENEWLAITKQFWTYGVSPHREALVFNGWADLPYWENPQLPFIAYLGAIAWSIFGESIFSLRLIMIMINIITMFMVFVFVRKMARSNLMGLATATCYALMPMTLFFGRHISEGTIGNFFLVGFFICFMLWRDNNYKHRYSIAGSIFLVCAGMSKLPFLFPAIAVLGITPYKDIFLAGWRDYTGDKKKVLLYVSGWLSIWQKIAGFFLFPILLVGFFVYLHLTNVNNDFMGPLGGGVAPTQIFNFHEWGKKTPLLYDFWITNYNHVFGIAFVIGLLVTLVQKSPYRWFVVFYLLSIILSLMVFFLQMLNHSYYQIPFALLIALGMGHLLFSVANFVRAKTGAAWLAYALLLLPFLNYAQINESMNRQFNAQYWGGDVAGRLIQESTKREDRFFNHVYHDQESSVCFYAFRNCGSRLPSEVERIQEYENKFNSRFIYVSSANLQGLQRSPTWQHISNNYKLRQVGFIYQNDNQIRPYYYLLQRPGRFSFDEVKQIKPVVAGEYYIRGRDLRINFWTITTPAP